MTILSKFSQILGLRADAQGREPQALKHAIANKLMSLNGRKLSENFFEINMII